MKRAIWLAPQYANAKPGTAPPIASNSGSANEVRTNRHRVAPNAARTLSSAARPCARASATLARFTHASSRSNATIPKRMYSGRVNRSRR